MIFKYYFLKVYLSDWLQKTSIPSSPIVHDIYYPPSLDKVFAATGGGLYYSTDKGATWILFTGVSGIFISVSTSDNGAVIVAVV